MNHSERRSDTCIVYALLRLAVEQENAPTPESRLLWPDRLAPLRRASERRVRRYLALQRECESRGLGDRVRALAREVFRYGV